MSLCDSTFGPRIDPACRVFDFTLYFEDLFLAGLPAAAFLLLLPVPLYTLGKSPNVVKRSRLLAFKVAVFLGLATCQTAFLVLRLRHSDLQTRLSLAADSLGLAAVIGAGWLSWLQHNRSIQTSTLLAVLLAALSLVGIARVRTLWLILGASGGAAMTLTLGLALTLCALLLESLGKGKCLRSPGKFAGSGPEPFTGFWNRVGFAWLITTLRLGYQKILSVDDLPALDYRLGSHGLHHEKKTKHSLFMACFQAYINPFLGAVIPRLCLTGFTFAQPFMINSLIRFVENPHASGELGRAMIGGYALVYIGMAASTALYWYQTFRFLVRVRGGLISLVYQHTVQTREVDLGDINGLTLMGADVERIILGLRSIHEVWASLVDISIAIYLLEKQVYVACLVPGLLTLVFVLATFRLSAWAKSSQRLWVEKVEERLVTTSNMLKDIRAVKMLGVGDRMFDIISRFRQVEITKSKKFRKILVAEIFLSNSPSILAPVVTLGVVVAMAAAQNDSSILAAQAFTSLSLIALLTVPALTFIQAIPSMIQCLGCFDRIQEYCCRQSASAHWADELDQVQREPPGGEAGAGPMIELQACGGQTGTSDRQMPSHLSLITFRGQSFGWTKSGPAVLKSLDGHIKANRITAVLGPSGSGKSTLLESMLGETRDLGGWTEKNFTTAAYCAQAPWLTNSTIRENITGGPLAPALDEKWYASVLLACGLEMDLANLGQGDRTLVGDNGNKLSGGQKQRISLARAVYSRHPVILLDDVFSGVDGRNVALISQRLLGPHGILRRNRNTVVIVTHSSLLVSLADDILVLENGRILEHGSLELIRSAGRYVVDSLNEEQSSEVDVPPRAASDPPLDSPAPTEPCPEAAEIALTALAQERADLRRQTGDMSVYRYYSKAAGHGTVLVFLALMMAWTCCTEFSIVWVDWWSSANADDPDHNNKDGMYLGVYAALGIASPAFMTAACWFLFINVISNSAKHLHNALLGTITRASLRFFHETDLGSIMNRFSQDMELIGMDLPLTAINYVSAAFGCAGKVILLAIFAKYLAVTLPFLAGSVYMIQKFYLRTSRQVRLLDIEAKAPVYQLFLETTGGASTVRAFGWQHRFGVALQSLLDRSQRPVYILYCIQQWLALVLDMIVAVLAVVLVAIIVTWRQSFDPGAVGVALVTVMTFNKTLASLIKFWTMLETSIRAVGRIKTFVETTAPEEEELGICRTAQAIPAKWPDSGAIEFDNVVASYKPGGSRVLKHVSLFIKAGEKVAICGSSGSGKTSLILSLLHMIKFEGSVKIDGADISLLVPTDLRSRINVVPQEPFLMPGSLRFNVDLSGTVPDETIMAALQRLNLWDRVASSGGLSCPRPSSSWSVGEKQLLCLARAMVRRSGVLILDEATSSVDPVTESIMQDVIETEFSTQTILAVVHRLRYITRFDKVAVLRGGRLVEYDTPDALLARPSILADMYKAGGYQ